MCTPETAALVDVWYSPNNTRNVHTVPYGPTWDAEEARCRLLPSGHILGGAMLHVETAAGALLYAGDLRLSGSPTCPGAEIVRADHLIIEDTFGAVDAPFLGPKEGAERTVEACLSLRASGRTPVIVTLSNCGKAQDLLPALDAAGLRAALQAKIWCFTEVYRRLGKLSCQYERIAHQQMNSCDVCVVTASYLARQPRGLQRMVPDPAYVLVSGWAAEGPVEPYEVAIPWSDHASRDELLSIVDQVQPELVWTFAGEGEMAEALGNRGIAAEHLALE